MVIRYTREKLREARRLFRELTQLHIQKGKEQLAIDSLSQALENSLAIEQYSLADSTATLEIFDTLIDLYRKNKSYSELLLILEKDYKTNY